MNVQELVNSGKWEFFLKKGDVKVFPSDADWEHDYADFLKTGGKGSILVYQVKENQHV